MRKTFSLLSLLLMACPSPDFEFGTEDDGYGETGFSEVDSTEINTGFLSDLGDGDGDACNQEAWDVCYTFDEASCKEECSLSEETLCEETACFGVCEKTNVLKMLECNAALGELSCAPDSEWMNCELLRTLEKGFCFDQAACEEPGGFEFCEADQESMSCD